MRLAPNRPRGLMGSTERPTTISRRSSGFGSARSSPRRSRSGRQHALNRARRHGRAAGAHARRLRGNRVSPAIAGLARLHRQVRVDRPDLPRRDGGRSRVHAAPARSLPRDRSGVVPRSVRVRLDRRVLPARLERRRVTDHRNRSLHDLLGRRLRGPRRARAHRHGRRQAPDECDLRHGSLHGAFAFLTPFFFIKGGWNGSLGAVGGNLGLLAMLLAAKMVPKIGFIYPLARRADRRHGTFITLLMSTSLTFGTISSLYGLNAGIIDKTQFSLLVSVVVLSAVVPTAIAERWFLPDAEREQRIDRRLAYAESEEYV